MELTDGSVPTVLDKLFKWSEEQPGQNIRYESYFFNENLKNYIIYYI
jgi:hypothetical protein